jgi:hypothetical protein
MQRRTPLVGAYSSANPLWNDPTLRLNQPFCEETRNQAGAGTTERLLKPRWSSFLGFPTWPSRCAWTRALTDRAKSVPTGAWRI